MSAAVRGIDTVGKSIDRFGKAIIVLQSRFDRYPIYRFRDINRITVLHNPVAVQVPDEADYATLKVKCGGGVFGIITEYDFQALVQVGYFS